MEANHRELLRSHRMALCSDMNSELVATRLVEAKVFTERDEQTIASETSSVKKNEKLLDILPKRGPRAFQAFVDVLKAMNLTNLTSLIDLKNKLVSSEVTVNDLLDGRPKPDLEEKLPSKVDSGVVSPVGKQPKIDEEGLDTTDMPPKDHTEQEDGRLGFLVSKKLKGSPLPDEFQSPSYPTESTLDPSDCYPMRSLPRGLFLLINNKDFEPASGMDRYPRNGTDRDADAIKELFEELGFIVESHRNIGIYQMRKAFKEAAAKDYSGCSAFACCVLTHGQEGILYGTDGTIDIKEITGYFRGSNLVGKPKIFIFQACQGSEYMDGVVPDGPGDRTDGPGYGNNISLPTESDFLYAYSTVPGYYSWRNSARGSWFIQAIVEVFREYAHKMDVVRMLTRVNNIVSTKKSQTGQYLSHDKRQISSIITQMRKELYLFPPHGQLKQVKLSEF